MGTTARLNGAGITLPHAHYIKMLFMSKDGAVDRTVSDKAAMFLSACLFVCLFVFWPNLKADHPRTFQPPLTAYWEFRHPRDYHMLLLAYYKAWKCAYTDGACDSPVGIMVTMGTSAMCWGLYCFLVWMVIASPGLRRLSIRDCLYSVNTCEVSVGLMMLYVLLLCPVLGYVSYIFRTD